jgi:hypothetical protein
MEPSVQTAEDFDWPNELRGRQFAAHRDARADRRVKCRARGDDAPALKVAGRVASRGTPPRFAASRS